MSATEEKEQLARQVRHAMLEFQIGDLETSAKYGLNFLTAIGVMVSVEFLGGLLVGSLGSRGHSKERFEAGFAYLGGPYSDLLGKSKKGILDVYDNVRCGLIHQYLPTNVIGVLSTETFGSGIAEINGQYVIFVSDFVRDLKNAVINLLEELDKGGEAFLNCKKAIGQIPTLL